MKKLCLLLAVLFFACSDYKRDNPFDYVNKDEGTETQGYTWIAEGDGSSSTASSTQSSNVVTFTGNVVKSDGYGFASLISHFTDAAVLQSLRTANTISFKAKGDGKNYMMHLVTSDITDFGYYEYKFSTIANEEILVTINLSDLKQPVWGDKKTGLDKSVIQSIVFQAHSDNIIGAFSITISDLKFY